MALRNIVLIGFMGTGKSSIGRLLAQKLGLDFLDTDRLIIQRAGMEIAAIFAQHGESFFRDLESEVLASLADGVTRVIATGGGIILRESNRALLHQLGLVICLSANEEVLFERVSRNRKRPLLQTANPRETLHQIITERRALYEQAAQVTIDTSSLTQPEVADLILAQAQQAFSCQLLP